MDHGTSTAVLLTGAANLLFEHVYSALAQDRRRIYTSVGSSGALTRIFANNFVSTTTQTDVSDNDQTPVVLDEMWCVLDSASNNGKVVAEDAIRFGVKSVVIVVCEVTGAQIDLLSLLGEANGSTENGNAEFSSFHELKKTVPVTVVIVGPMLKAFDRSSQAEFSSASLLMLRLLGKERARNSRGFSDGEQCRITFLDPVCFEKYLVSVVNASKGKSIRMHGAELMSEHDLRRILTGYIEHAKTRYVPNEDSFGALPLVSSNAIAEEWIPPETEKLVVEIDDVAREAGALVRQLTGDAAATFFDVDSVTTGDDVPLRVFRRCGSGETLLFVNAYGMSADLLVPLAKSLPNVDFITWESRYSPVLGEKFDEKRTSVKDHADDVLSVLEHYRIDKLHIAGWCTGAQVCLRFAHDYPHRVKSLSLINGAYSLESLKQVEFHQSILGLLMKAASDLEVASVLRRLAYGAKVLEGLERKEGVQTGSSNGLPQQTDQHLAEMLRQLFCSGINFHRYAAMAVRLWEEPPHAWTPDIFLKTLVLTSSDDAMSPPHTSHEIAKMIPSSKFMEIDGADHYMLYTQHMTVADALAKFMQQAQMETKNVSY